MTAKSETLWRHRDFRKLWSAQATSSFGTQLASLAYPLTAVITLQATAFEIGMLRATSSAAAVLVGLFAGVIVDRIRRKPILIVSDLGRAILALTIPAAAILGFLRIEQLYIVGFFAGALNILSEVAAMAFLPSVVERAQLVEGNSKFAATDSIATIAGQGASGALVQILTAPIAIVVDAVSFVVSAFFVWTIDAPEQSVYDHENRQSVWTEIAEGLRFVYRNPILRPLSEAIALHFFFILMIGAIFTLYAIRELGLAPLLLGIVLSALGLGFLLGAATAKSITNRFGIGRTMICATLLNAFSCLFISFASGSPVAVVLTLIAAHLLLAFGIQIHGINLMSLRQSITPDNLQGRMNASFRFLNVLMMMTGALIGGVLGEWIGLRAAITVGACGMFLPFLRLIVSPLRNFR